MRHALAAALAAAVLSAPAAAQVDYARAERLLPWHTQRLVSGDQVQPQFIRGSDRFWYRNKTAAGAEFVLVDPVANRRAPLFDHARLAAAMTLAADTAFDAAALPFTTFTFGDDGENERVIEFNAVRKRFACDLGRYACTIGDTLPNTARFVRSPDKRLEAFIHQRNVWVRNAVTKGDSVQLTTDGVEHNGYGLTEPRPTQLRSGGPDNRTPNLRWSPDSKRLAVLRQDERHVAHMHYISYTPQRPRHFSQPYALPGDTAVPHPRVHLIDVASKANVVADLPVRPNLLSIGGSVRDSAWTADGGTVHLSWLMRGSKAAYLAAVDAATGEARIIARDTGKTYVEIANPQDPASFYVTKDRAHAFWWSERDGWGHLYRFDGRGVDSLAPVAGSTLRRTPEPQLQLTSGDWQVGQISHVDEAAKQVYFTARGRDGFLYYPKLYRVNFDGTGLTLLTPEDGFHTITFSPSGKYVVDQYSRIEAAPTTVLREARTGRVIRTLEEADVSRLAEAGWTPAQVVTVKARDGVTDLYGVLYLPPGLDSTKRYPIISHIYPGPQVGSVGSWQFKGGSEPHALAQLGFIVLQLDHLGTPLRSKAFHDNYYGFFGDNGLPDHITAIQQLAARHAFIDLGRVGIFGHSGGGFASTDAMLRFPDFFHVAVSGAGNHDNRSYNIYWAEKYQGLMLRDSLRRTDNFANSANQLMAKNLKGKLLLMHGDMDDNVHPAMTVQVVDELIKANKSFDLVWAPNRAHSLNEPYFIRRRWDYFVQHLLGATPPDNYELRQPAERGARPTATPSWEDYDDGWPFWKPFLAWW
jgi:dipeptidyl aminopeptidase/acylaminoacyl peptidase